MTDLSKMKLQLRTSLSRNSPERTPTPPAKLMINHGKPNFILPRSNTKKNGIYNGTTSLERIRNNSINDKEYKTKPIQKSSTFYGLTRPSIQTLSLANDENEMNKVVLRRTKFTEASVKEDNNNNNDKDNYKNNDDNVPEFIKRQRRIQERLAKENILDFENRRSGYFTQCMLSPTTNNRQSFSPTMASPAIVPALEMDMPSMSKVITSINTTTTTTTITTTTTTTTTTVAATAANTNDNNNKLNNSLQMKNAAEVDQPDQADLDVSNSSTPILMNGNSMAYEKYVDLKEMLVSESVEEEEEVAKAIEEVNKAVEGEDDDNHNHNHNHNHNNNHNNNNNRYETIENCGSSYDIKRKGIEKEIELIIAKAAAVVLQKKNYTPNHNDCKNKLENVHVKYLENDSIIKNMNFSIKHSSSNQINLDSDATK